MARQYLYVQFLSKEKFEHQIDTEPNEIPKPEDLPSDWELRNKAIEQLHGKKRISSF